MHSPLIEKIEVTRVGKVRRAKLYYLRDRVGKAAKTRENIGANLHREDIVIKEEVPGESEEAENAENTEDIATEADVKNEEVTEVVEATEAEEVKEEVKEEAKAEEVKEEPKAEDEKKDEE